MLDIAGLDVFYGPVQALRGLSLRRVSTSRTAGPDWSIGLSLQHYRAGDRPDATYRGTRPRTSAAWRGGRAPGPSPPARRPP